MILNNILLKNNQFCNVYNIFFVPDYLIKTYAMAHSLLKKTPQARECCRPPSKSK